MGAITQAMAAAAAQRRAPRSAPARRWRAIDAGGGRVRGVALEDGTEIAAPLVLSNADPKRTFLGLVERGRPARGVPRGRGRDQDGRPLRQGQPRPLRGAARHGHARGALAGAERALFTLVPSLEFAERCYDMAKLGEIPEELWVDCVVASNVDPTPRARRAATS